MTLFFLLHTPTTTTPFTKLRANISATYSNTPHRRPQTHQQKQNPEPRDRVIDFGRHKGKPLGSLPSNYLKWVSRNLRSGDSLQWAELADRVLQDPVYKDRIEWEMAENLLSGDVFRNKGDREDNVVNRLVEVSERFGWDNEDKLAWSRVDFGLLGTSYGGGIPRKVVGEVGSEDGESVVEVEEEREGVVEERRRERRLRRVRGKMGIEGDGDGEKVIKEKLVRKITAVRGKMENEENVEEKLGIEGNGEAMDEMNVRRGKMGIGENGKGEERLRVIREKLRIRDDSEGSIGNLDEKKENKVTVVRGKIGIGGNGDGERRLRVIREKLRIRDNGEGGNGNLDEKDENKVNVERGKTGTGENSDGERRLRVIREKLRIRDDGGVSTGNSDKREGNKVDVARGKMGIRDSGGGSLGIGHTGGGGDRTVTRDNVKGSYGNGKKSGDDVVDKDRTVKIKSPFPGREALLKKVMRSRRFL